MSTFAVVCVIIQGICSLIMLGSMISLVISLRRLMALRQQKDTFSGTNRSDRGSFNSERSESSDWKSK